MQPRINEYWSSCFPPFTLFDVKGTRKASTPAQWRRAFIERTKAARVHSGKEPAQVAAFLGVPLDTYKRWEKRYLLPHHLVMPFCACTASDPVFLLTGKAFDLGRSLHGGSNSA